jgi:glycosyltransferase involved in cell wall biosynthesis
MPDDDAGHVPVMCIFIEPAPYISRLDQELKKQWSGRVRTWFVSDAVSQKWDGLTENSDFNILPRGKIAATYELWRGMKQCPPKIVFIAGWSHPVIIGAIMMAKLVGARVVSTSDTWKSESTGIRKLCKISILRMIDRFTPSGKCQVRYLRDLGVSASRVFPANMTVDTKAMQIFFAEHGAEHRRIIRNELGIDAGVCVFLFVGRLEPIKGIDLLLSAFGELGPNIQARLVIVGDGTLRQEANEAMERDTRIVYRGRLQGEALWAQFAAADILVAPSLSEPWGLVVNEALSAGLAIVVSDLFGCRDDLIKPERNALVVPAGNQVAVTEILKRLVADPNLVERLRGNAMQSVEGWTTEAWAANTLEAWRDAMSQKESYQEHA